MTERAAQKGSGEPGGDSRFVERSRMPDFALWKKVEGRRVPLFFTLELTARCNNDCRHCYINLPAGDSVARRGEMSLTDIDDIAWQAADLGALWCLVTGGEPLLRPDFADIYLALRKRGLLLSLFTNACLVTPKIVHLLREHPPRDIEVSVYGAGEDVYERVTRQPGSYAAFRRGLDLLLEAGLKVDLKTVLFRSNVQDVEAIGRFCRTMTNKPFRFDPFLHLRYDGDKARNAEIRAERLTPEEIAALEREDPDRLRAIQDSCEKLILPESAAREGGSLFYCGAGLNAFAIGWDGRFKLCSGLTRADCVYDLRAGTLRDAWENFVPCVRARASKRDEFMESCGRCALVALGLCCPARVDLETGELDGRADYFCRVAHAREPLVRGGDAVSPAD